jgi:hypothetical protein
VVGLPRPCATHRSRDPYDRLRPHADWEVSRFLSRLPAETHFFPKNTTAVTNPTRGARTLFAPAGTKHWDNDGSDAIGLPGSEGRAGVAVAIPDYSITSMSGSTQERSK